MVTAESCQCLYFVGVGFVRYLYNTSGYPLFGVISLPHLDIGVSSIVKPYLRRCSFLT